MLQIIADILGIIGGVWLLLQFSVRLYHSYKIGFIANLLLKRKISNTEKLIETLEKSGYIEKRPELYPDLSEHIKNLKLTKMANGSDEEKIEAIQYVRHLGADNRIDATLKALICTANVARKVMVLALEVLHSRLNKTDSA